MVVSTYSDAKEEYQYLRDSAYRNTLSQLQKRDALFRDICLAPINIETLQLANRWEDRRLKHDWIEYSNSFKRHPRRFELSIWHKHTLCALAIGRASKGGSHVRIDMLEKNPDSPIRDHFYIAFMCAINYAVEIGRDKVLIKEPINNRVTQHYMSVYPDFHSLYESGSLFFPFKHIEFDLKSYLSSKRIASSNAKTPAEVIR